MTEEHLMPSSQQFQPVSNTESQISSLLESQSEAIEEIRESETFTLNLPFVGKVRIPRPEQMAYYAGIGLLAATEVIDWPVALIVIAGHMMASNHRYRLIEEFGEALEQA